MPNLKPENIDVVRLRQDLKRCIGLEGLARRHMELSDTELIVQFVYVYGISALIPYTKGKENGNDKTKNH